MSKTASFPIFKRLVSETRPYGLYFLLGIIGTIILSGVDAGFTWLLQPLLDKGFVDKDQAFIKVLPLLIVSIFVLRAAGGFMSDYFISRVAQSVVLNFRRDLFSKYLKLPASFFDSSSSGHLLSTIVYNVSNVTAACSTALITALREFTLLVGLVVIMFVINWQLSSFFFVVFPFVAYVIRWSSMRMKRLSLMLQETMGSIVSITEESLENYKVVRIFGGEQYEQSKFYKSIRLNFHRQMKVAVTNTLGSSGTQLLLSIPIAVTLYVSTMPSIGLSAGSFAAIIGAMASLLRPLKRLTGVNNSLQQGIAGAESIYDILDKPEEIDTGTQVMSQVQGSIKFDSVYFNYKKSVGHILKDLSLDIHPGETVALVGRSGAGKSTLISLLPRFYDVVSGSILIDNHNINDYSLASLRSHFSIVTQQTTLFNDTIAKNITYGSSDVSQDRLHSAAQAACATEFIMTLPDGFDSVVGDNGVLLSGGQRQRIAIARALLKKAPILILDEATASLDSHSERAIQEALDHLMEGCTSIVIAHRLSTILNADKIVVMDHGAIVEVGQHEELLKKKGIYSELYQIQFDQEEK